MRQALPTGLVRLNVYTPRRREAQFDFMREHTEASSDSEVTRQALRHFEQFVEDEQRGIKLKTVTDGAIEWWAVDRFRDPKLLENLERRSLIMHRRTVDRLQRLQIAMNAKDFSEVIRSALRFYLLVVGIDYSRTHLFIVFPTGEEYQLRIGTLYR